jgi:hypothetical protein
MTFFKTFLRLVSALPFVVKPARVANFSMSVLLLVLVSGYGKVMVAIRDTSGLDLRLWHMAQRMSTSRAVRPAALEALLAMTLLALLWVGVWS